MQHVTKQVAQTQQLSQLIAIKQRQFIELTCWCDSSTLSSGSQLTVVALKCQTRTMFWTRIAYVGVKRTIYWSTMYWGQKNINTLLPLHDRPSSAMSPWAQAQTGYVPLYRHNSWQPPLLMLQGLVPTCRTFVNTVRSLSESPTSRRSTVKSDKLLSGAILILPRS